MGISKLSLKNSDKLNFLSNLSTMISSGIPILETIDSLLEDSKGNMRKMLEILREDILQGNHLYTSFAKFPDIFDKVTVNVIRASEEAGTLDVTLKDIRAQLEKEIEFHDKIRSAMVYPIFIILVFFGVMIMMLVVVMPKISSVFSRLNVDLPLPTRIMIGMSDIVTKYTLPLLAGTIVMIIFMILIFKAQRKAILGVFYKLPIISTLVKEIDLAHFSRSMFLLLSSGITITNALDLAQEVVMRKDISNAVGHAKETVLAGKQLSQAFKDHKDIFSGIVIKLVEAGEKTGTLDKSLQDVSKQMDYQVNNTLDTLTAMIEPIMLVVVGLLVGGMMLAIIAPIYGLIGQIGPK
jgi:type II secretory pathway component PulF